MDAARSHTDILTNVVVLSALDIGRHFDEILERDLPIATLPTFLHEATHHWCFDTPVGLALHLLFMRARRAAFDTLTGSGDRRDEGWRALDSVVRYELVRELLQPLSEGVALFAEHDAIPGAAQTISTPMTRAAGLYARGYAISGAQPYDGMPFVLAAARVSRNHTRRKAALYLEPMTCASGGYLPGYLIMKGLWRFAIRHAELFRDSDFFLQYIRSHLFDDWGLVARLLDPTKKDLSALDPITKYVSQRLRAFVEVAVDADRARRFERLSKENQFQTIRIRTDLLELDLNYLPLDAGTDVELGRTRLKDAFTSYFAGWTGNERLDALLEQDRAEVVQRLLVNLGQITVDAEPASRNLQLSYRGEPVMTVAGERFAEGVDGLRGPIDLDLLSLDEPGGLCFTLSRDGQFLGTVPLGTADLSDGLRRTLVSRDTRSQRSVSSEALIAEALKQADVNVESRVIREEYRAGLDDWFLPIALMHVESTRVSDMRRRTLKTGLFDLFEGDARLLLDAAVASLCIPSPFNFRSVEPFHRWSADTPQDAIVRINQKMKKNLGFAPFVVNDQNLFEQLSFI